MDDGDEPIHRPLPAAVTASPTARHTVRLVRSRRFHLKKTISGNQFPAHSRSGLTASIDRRSLLVRLPPSCCRVAAVQRMSPMCHVWTAPAVQGEFDVAANVGCGHVFGLLLQPLWPLAMM
jgi:hypothetical protein